MKKNEVVNWEELITSNMLQLEAIVRVLERKLLPMKKSSKKL